VGAKDKAGHITKGDVLEDLGFTVEEILETEMKLTIWRPLLAEIESRGLAQAAVAELLQIHQPDASLLVRGRLSRFSVMKLMQLAERLGLTVRLSVKSAAARTPRLQKETLRRSNSTTAKSKARARIAA
jgi:predicted XRE-type DNA-binding protein